MSSATPSVSIQANTNSEPNGLVPQVNGSNIVYAVVARGTNVLAQHSSERGNYEAIAARILAKVPEHNVKSFYENDSLSFNFLISDGVTYLCIARKLYPRRLVFSFLEEIKKRFLSLYADQVSTAGPLQMQHDFRPILQQQMEYFSNEAEADKLAKVQQQVDEVTSVMRSNIDEALNRGERLDVLVDRAEDLRGGASQFQKSSTQLKRNFCKRNMKIIICIVIVVVLIALAIILGVVLTQRNSSSGGSGGSSNNSGNSTRIVWQ
ncbi:Vesicle-associated membrane protein 7 [Galdieria sulphuraria]|uniref:Vesicle-associated membrane protein 7 n=1 Tax=Galdieria sulphuraria TaxID=130081 RepID=M2Y6K8_GALSU|nr:vesicle-associated membrane protein 7 [Galdieria sulphuraria]EME31489.1 vesicle-associated membrane protein 7 [Galdieria sulphuraria]GJD10262.1 Vesicle-associated membrane protein 7 [Galdieria sulphuraria]|eukprot:XP_005708009.1 vesicle-associated membrane protein 7 [Galdieria sulphuraria]